MPPIVSPKRRRVEETTRLGNFKFTAAGTDVISSVYLLSRERDGMEMEGEGGNI